MAKKQVLFRLDEENIDKFKIYAIKNKTTMQEILENYVLSLVKDDNNDSDKN